MSDEPQKKEGAGVPAWVMTFADLMTLLMCFFVLLLSFAEMDLIKFKQVAGSMKQAFGVQRQVESDRTQSLEDFLDGQTSEAPLHEKVGELDAIDPKSLDPQVLEKLLEEIQAEQTKAEASKLAALLSEEIAAGAVELESTTDSVIIRINEKASFPSGRAKLRSGFKAVLDKIHLALAEVEGKVTVAGHTDDRPIHTKRFRSNWELSAGRAVSVVHALLQSKLLDSRRFLIEGHGDSLPLVVNDTPENRARNRRVEITLVLRKVDSELLDGGDAESEAGEAPGSEEVTTNNVDEKLDNVDGAPGTPDETSQSSGAGSTDVGSDSAPPGIEQELPGMDTVLPEYDGDLDTPEELELLLRALDTAGDLPLDNE